MQAAVRKPRPDLVWSNFWPLINKVIHIKREQLGQLRFYGLDIGTNGAFIVQVSR
jgi:hypothetical protein